MLTPSQRYQIKKMKHKRANVLLAMTKRKCGPESVCTRKLILFRMNRALHERFQIERIDDLPESQFDEYLQAIKSYGFYYGNIYIG